MSAAEVAAGNDLTFHHLHIYAKEVKSLAHYNKLEKLFNDFSKQLESTSGSIADGQALYKQLSGADPKPDAFVPNGQDIVEQFIAGMGYRIVGFYEGQGTRTVCVTPMDASGAKFVISAAWDGSEPAESKADNQQHAHFDVKYYNQFHKCHANRPGIGVLSFLCGAEGQIDAIHEAYKATHPKLLVPNGSHEYTDGAGGVFKVLEVYAYYQGQVDDIFEKKGDQTVIKKRKTDQELNADEGTVLRYVSVNDAWRLNCEKEGLPVLLAGLHPLRPAYPVDADAMRVYSDHWVSNVIDRQMFLKVLKDTVGFNPKVDFNAGVVAAGEAIIESTVAGNDAVVKNLDKKSALGNQQQIFLPINNALSEVGHVYLYLRELGQGVQHTAQRCEDIISFIARVNKYREMTGHGFSFLRIPRSYYGRLSAKYLATGGSVSNAEAEAVITSLQGAKLVDIGGIVNMDITKDQVKQILSGAAAPIQAKADRLADLVLKARYNNMYSLLKDNLSEESYLKIIENQILVDIQGQDILYQIFTSNVLQNNAGEEAPFLEFIQRVCSEQKDASGKPKPIKAGCGGFGIRNFLTLFLSIEVTKAMHELSVAQAANDAEGIKRSTRMVDTFTEQLEESNPILTAISDAMTAEADAMDAIAELGSAQDAASVGKREALQLQVEQFCATKNAGQAALQKCSDKYVAIMQEIRGA